ncbi:MAG: ABC transporter ATP-binding protein [Myxococcales bacterium]|nr:ABC transporter ATP-binding protein [Myxococcales bacterium]MCB9579974.1 ABC transporter ATP-binding protein [Polyangiaceae bacterium]
MAPARVLVDARGVSKTFGHGELATPVLRGIDLQVFAGELALLMGPSGSGKTTLISVLAGLLKPSGGRVELCGETITELAETAITRIRRQHLGFVFQSYNLFPALTALENIAEVLKMKGTPPETADDKATAALSIVGLGERLHHRPGELSGGQKQRVAIARALAGDPSLILGDEVTAALDTHTALNVVSILRQQVSPERGILLVTHDHRLAEFADRVIEIEDGAVSRVVPGGAA